MAVDVDETGRDHEARNVEPIAGFRSREIADARDPAFSNADVGSNPGDTGAVDDRAAGENEIEALGRRASAENEERREDRERHPFEHRAFYRTG
jgi:hypothetical protein